MDIRSLDLNLLLVFDAVARLRSVNKAADALGMSQPATSGALSRLRVAFEDPLFVRTRARMEPTARALELGPPVRQVILTIESGILKQPVFDPARSDRSFTVLTPDIGEVAFLPGVLQRLQHEAPHVHLRTVSRPPAAAAEALETGEADLAIGFFPDLQKASYFQQSLFKTSYVCIASESNRALGAKPTQKAYLAARHIVIRPDGREHLLERFMDAKGWRRRVVLEVSHFMSLLSLLPGTDLLATVPGEIADVLERHVPLLRIELPFRSPQIQVRQYWHRRSHEDPAHRWFRGVSHQANRREARRG
jgi:DNA-binding transcriptional LysR family regulator